MRSRAAEAHAADVSRDPTRMLTRFELPRPSAQPAQAAQPAQPAPLESGTHAIDRTVLMRPFESVKLLAASLPTPCEAMTPVPVPPPEEADPAPQSERRRMSERPTLPELQVVRLPSIAELAPMPEPPPAAGRTLGPAAGLWQALALSVAMSAAFGVGAKVVGVLLF